MKDNREYNLTVDDLIKGYCYECETGAFVLYDSITDAYFINTIPDFVKGNEYFKLGKKEISKEKFREYIEPEKDKEQTVVKGSPIDIIKSYMSTVSRHGLDYCKKENDLNGMNYYNGELSAYGHCLNLIEKENNLLHEPPQTSGDQCSKLSRRDYFAAMAMQGTLANPHCWESYTRTEIIKEALQVSDLLIKKLDKENKDAK